MRVCRPQATSPDPTCRPSVVGVSSLSRQDPDLGGRVCEARVDRPKGPGHVSGLVPHLEWQPTPFGLLGLNAEALPVRPLPRGRTLPLCPACLRHLGFEPSTLGGM